MKLSKTKILLILILLLAIFLRLYKIDENPVSLFGDELDVGYHALSILQTGKDYTGHFLPQHFRSLAELRTPLYLYSSVPSVAIFGVSPLGVRLPAVIFGVLCVWLLYFLVKYISGNTVIALISALLLSILPWHIQYSRAGFEVTELMAFYLAGIYFFLRGLKEHRLIFLSVIFFGFTPWIYNIAKLYLPLTVLGLLAIFWNDIKVVPKKFIFISFVIFTLITGAFTYNTLFGGGVDRFESISIASDNTIIPQIGFSRLRDAKMRDSSASIGAVFSLSDKLFHNQPFFLFNAFIKNYLQAYSAEFLTISGSTNLRHSVPGVGQIYAFEFIFMLIGGAFFFFSQVNNKVKLLMLFLILTTPIPSALTIDGGTHPTRLFLMIIPITIMTAYGIWSAVNILSVKIRKAFIGIIALVILLSFVFYQHTYWIHYPWDSERWWQAGYSEAIKATVEEGKKYDRVIISNADEPSLIFFLGYNEYPPEKFQKNYLLPETNIPGFGNVSNLDKYYFPAIGKGVGLYDLGKILPSNTLYLATAKEVNVNLITEPERVPKGINLIRSITYPSGAPAFYLLSKIE
ncbi:MAG: glycosyltransferase family 39 protein [Candidatus Daviesbacteria bacterium]|nr:glycosyltransferase family 39 protein [Candidatus Daviesbacteria bacterium]